MTQIEESLAPHAGAVIALQAELSTWFIDHALPLWDHNGIDRASGGFFESITARGPRSALRASGEVRRGRVVSRQIYVFDVARRLGWRPSGLSPVAHGCDFLFSRLYRGEGQWHTSLNAEAWTPSAPFSLYEQAFYLFALARLFPTMADRYPIAATATRCLQHLRGALGKEEGGFEESEPPSTPLKSNPHMHLLEAALAWIEVSEGSHGAPWVELARELVSLCLSRFRDTAHGAVREYFDGAWNPAAGDAGRIVEPGHQYEWAWLLLAWASLDHCKADERDMCVEAAERLVDLAERYGIDPVRGVAVNEIWDDLSLKDADAKLWPQTERVKAWCAMLARAQTPAQIECACRHIAAAARGMAKYLRADVPGLWHEVYSAEGQFLPGPSRASSMYHIVCAIDVLRLATQHHLVSDVKRARTEGLI